MGILTGIKALLGAPKIVSVVADSVKSGMTMWDNSNYTDQEKAANTLKMTDLWLKIQEATANENSIKSITRRILAWGIIGNFLIIINVGVYFVIVGSLEKVTTLKEFLLETKMGWMAVAVVVFYFGYYGIQAIRGKK